MSDISANPPALPTGASTPTESTTVRRRRWAGALMVAGGLALVVAQVLQPRQGDDVFAVSIAQSRTAWTAWGLLVMASAVLQLPGVTILRGSVPDGRGSRLVVTGGSILWLALIGLFAFGHTHAVAATLAGPTPVPQDVLESFARLDSDVSLGIVTVLGLLGFHLGWPLLLAGLGRSRSIAAPLAIVGSAALFLSFFGSVLGRWGEISLFVLAALCICRVGVGLARSGPGIPAEQASAAEGERVR